MKQITMTANPEIIALREEVRPYSITMRRIDSGLEILVVLINAFRDQVTLGHRGNMDISLI